MAIGQRNPTAPIRCPSLLQGGDAQRGARGAVAGPAAGRHPAPHASRRLRPAGGQGRADDRDEGASSRPVRRIVLIGG
jgi:hypothetical protein